MFFPLIIILLGLITESFATSWYSGAVHAKINEKPPLMLPVALALIKSSVLWLGIFLGNLSSDSIPWFYMTMAWALVFIIGLKMLTESLRFNPEERIVIVDNSKTLLLVSVAGSFNTFFIGISLGVLKISFINPVLITFAGTILLGFFALIFGKKYGLRPIVRYINITSAVLIALIALRFFILYFL